MLIDETYFTKRLNVPQRGNAEGLTELLDFIEQYEAEYLKCVLGQLWPAFDAGTEGSGTPDQRWQDLIDGKDYTKNGCTYSWVGFAPASKLSPIANYVYWQYLTSKIEQFTLTGVTVSSTDNNRTVPATALLVDAWNKMVDMNKHLYHFLKANAATYPEFKLCFHVVNNCGYPDWDSCGCEDCGPNPCRELYRKKNTLGL